MSKKDKTKKKKPKLRLEGGGGRRKGTTYGGGRATAQLPITDNLTLEPYIQGYAAKGDWGSDAGISGYGGSLTFEFKEGGMIIKDRNYLKGK